MADYEPIGARPRWGRRIAGACGLAAAAGLGAFALRTSPVVEGVAAAPALAATAVAAAAEGVQAKSVANPMAASLEFQLYKIALSVREGEAHRIRDFVNNTFAHMDPNYDLGCDGIKVNGYLMSYGPQVHWVESSILSNDPQPIKLWQDYFESLNGDLGTWNAFMHNKVSMFTSNLTAPYLRLVELHTPLMLRRSTGYTGKSSPSGELAHVLFQVAGRMYEITGPVTAEFASWSDAWDEWSDFECPSSHRLDSNLDEYVATYDGYVADANEMMTKWYDMRGYYPPMLAGVSIATAETADESLDGDALTDDLQSIAAVHSYSELDSDTCSITRVATVSAKGFRSPVRYVTNVLANNAIVTSTDPSTGETSGLTVADYNSYIFKTHAEIAGAYDDWSGWDHWMDQHIGLKYVGPDACAVSAQLNANLTSRGIAVGQRTTADYGQESAIHWYTGYAGSMTWEYWVSGCASTSTYSTDSEADVCACNAANNDKLFYEETGTNCTSFGETQWLIHDRQ